MSELPPNPNENHILSTLPRDEYERIARHLQPVELSQGKVLYHIGDRIEHVYFPEKSMVSHVAHLSDGTGVEVGVTGFEGMVGLPALLGVDESPHECMTQMPDGAMRAGVREIREEFRRGGALHDSVLRHAQTMMLTASQVAACNRGHTLGERLARWLLMTQDRCKCEDLPLTQEFLAMMLGVRRAGVSEAACALQTEGLIRYRRGHITIEDREAMEDYACECYGVLKEDFDRLTS